MEYKIAICDDNRADTDYLLSLVKSWATAAGHSVAAETYLSAEAFLFHYEDDKSYDILLLDIEMAQMTGIELAKHIRAGNREVQIIFITGYTDYIADGYDVEALHYIVKPVQREKLHTVLNRACERLRKNESVLLLDIPDGMVRIPLYEVRYIEVRSNYVTIHAEQDISVKASLSSMIQYLDNAFFRIGRSFVVNMRYIRRITKTEVTLDSGIALPLSRGLYEPLNRAFIQYF